MVKNRIIQYLMKDQNSKISIVLIFNYRVLNDLLLFLATLTGYIPSHVIRLVFYRNLFQVKIPSDSTIYWKCKFFRPKGVSIGHNTIIGNDAFLDGRKGIYIGNNVNIGGEVRIYTMEHNLKSPDFVVTGESVHINDLVYIGTRVTILPGIKIGEGAVVASGAVVTKNVDSWAMVGGIPAKFIKHRPIVNYKLDTSKRKFFQ